MAHLITLFWRDIPAQVIAESGRGRNRQQAKIELPRRFAIAIDAAAMKDGADSTDDYLAEWRRSEPVSCSDESTLHGGVERDGVASIAQCGLVRLILGCSGLEVFRFMLKSLGVLPIAFHQVQ